MTIEPNLKHALSRNAHLQKTLDTVVDIASTEPVESILLVGSMARNEITILSESEPFDLWSDIDLFMSTDFSKGIDQGRLRTAYRDLYLELGMANPFFHIDFSVVRSSRLGSLPHRISTFEAKKNGQTLWGRDINSDLPDVTLNNLDFGNTNHLILIRLTEMLFFTPTRIVSGRYNTYEEKVFSYVQARNALDILTILLPHEGILLPSYVARNHFLQENFSTMQSRRHMGPDFRSFQEESLHSKLTLEFKSSPLELYKRTLEGYMSLTAYLLRSGPFGSVGEVCAVLEKSELDLNSADTNFRQHLVNLKFDVLSKILNRPAIHPERNRKMIIIFLLWMHNALLAELRSEDHAIARLKNARAVLQILSMHPLPDPNHNFAQEWLTLREHYLDIFASVYPAKQTRRSYYRQVLNWQYTS